MTPTMTPRTAAGRGLLERVHGKDGLDISEWAYEQDRDAILAIEAAAEPAAAALDVERLRAAFWATQAQIKDIYREEIAAKEARGGFLYDHETDTRLIERYADLLAAAYDKEGQG